MAVRDVLNSCATVEASDSLIEGSTKDEASHFALRLCELFHLGVDESSTQNCVSICLVQVINMFAGLRVLLIQTCVLSFVGPSQPCSVVGFHI